MAYNPEIHHRKSYRLKGYDYSRQGLYFITVCTKDRKCFFGKIENDEMTLNDVGKTANDYWLDIPKHFPNAVLHEHVIMPNHAHGIIELTQGTSHVMSVPDNPGVPVGTRHVVSLLPHDVVSVDDNVASLHGDATTRHNQFSKPIAGSVSVIIQQYKSTVKRWCNQNNHEKFEWQSRFHDHIIRNHETYQRIAGYIADNPAQWRDDKFYIT